MKMRKACVFALLSVVVLLLIFTACGKQNEPKEQRELSYPVVVGTEGQEVRIGMTAEEFCQTLGVGLGEDPFMLSPVEGMTILVHDGLIRQIEITGVWTLKDEPGIGKHKDDVIAVRGEPDHASSGSIYAGLDTGEAETVDLPALYSISYAVGDGSLTYLYDTNGIIVDIAIQSFDSATMQQFVAERYGVK